MFRIFRLNTPDHVIDKALASCASTRIWASYQNDGMSLFIITVIALKYCASYKLACHSHSLYHAGDDAYKQFCLFSDSIICMYIIVLLIHAFYFQNIYCLNLIEQFCFNVFVINDVVHDEIIRVFLPANNMWNSY